jgi:hypothetical protein
MHTYTFTQTYTQTSTHNYVHTRLTYLHRNCFAENGENTYIYMHARIRTLYTHAQKHTYALIIRTHTHTYIHRRGYSHTIHTNRYDACALYIHIRTYIHSYICSNIHHTTTHDSHVWSWGLTCAYTTRNSRLTRTIMRTYMRIFATKRNSAESEYTYVYSKHSKCMCLNVCILNTCVLHARVLHARVHAWLCLYTITCVVIINTYIRMFYSSKLSLIKTRIWRCVFMCVWICVYIYTHTYTYIHIYICVHALL